MQNLLKRIKVKKYICLGLAVTMLLSLTAPDMTFAKQGDSGYDGGISSGEVPTATTSTTTSSKVEYDYQEPCFLSGVPIILSGTVTISKKLKDDTKTNTQTLTSTYTYSLANGDNKLTRTLVYVTTITPKSNGQKTESTTLSKATETVTLGGDRYIISGTNDYVLSKSNLIDMKPAVNYYNGTLRSKKTYHIGNARSTDTVVVETSGNYSGYDEYWSSAEAQKLEQTISYRKPGKTVGSIGKVSIDISTTTKKELKYDESIAEQTSVEGGYIQTQKNENILKYTAKLSELDKNKVPTTKVNTYTNSLKLESFPTQISLISPNLKQISGHPSEESISLMFGLEAFKENEAASFDPQEYMSRAEFIDAFINVAKEVPVDPVFVTKKKTTTNKKNVEVKSLFTDVSTNHTFFQAINEAAERGIVYGNGKSQFRPSDLITMQEAVTMMINSLGLNGLAPNPAPVTSFTDNDSISSFARPSMYVAERLGLIEEDSKGYIYPKSKVTKAKAAEMMKAYIEYMNNDIRSEYMDKILSY
ncbi:S-layer homology domain-containing protein [Ruminiclostridium herbifermentans]|uniref:S-layer homology domain-containing protein n=1 Tax=Ruminiclostridium herbifermentans TaxID=2488810 RepID=A0A4U7JHX6_9FIRM|nr:S-layer homology domain-containing protein [Ruminiclostridium herbifermentans]QNU66632.1 S-layer homology domain-containing protein [Ruminiclostridium herbifermentans]